MVTKVDNKEEKQIVGQTEKGGKNIFLSLFFIIIFSLTIICFRYSEKIFYNNLNLLLEKEDNKKKVMNNAPVIRTKWQLLNHYFLKPLGKIIGFILSILVLIIVIQATIRFLKKKYFAGSDNEKSNIDVRTIGCFKRSNTFRLDNVNWDFITNEIAEGNYTVQNNNEGKISVSVMGDAKKFNIFKILVIFNEDYSYNGLSYSEVNKKVVFFWKLFNHLIENYIDNVNDSSSLFPKVLEDCFYEKLEISDFLLQDDDEFYASKIRIDNYKADGHLTIIYTLLKMIFDHLEKNKFFECDISTILNKECKKINNNFPDYFKKNYSKNFEIVKNEVRLFFKKNKLTKSINYYDSKDNEYRYHLSSAKEDGKSFFDFKLKDFFNYLYEEKNKEREKILKRLAQEAENRNILNPQSDMHASSRHSAMLPHGLQPHGAPHGPQSHGGAPHGP